MKRIKGLESYNMKIKVLTPTFIGGGEDTKINKSQYIYDPKKKQLKIVDERKLASFLGKRNLLGFYSGYVKDLNDNIKNKRNKNENDMNLGEWFRKISSMVNFSGDIEECIKYSIDVSNIRRNQLNDVACFIKNVEGNPYIPGSSLKGAITNAILVDHIHRNRDMYRSSWEEIKRATAKPSHNNRDSKEMKKRVERVSNNLVKDIFDYEILDEGGRKTTYKGMSGLSVSDSSQFKREDMKLFQRKDLLLTDKKDNILPIFRECLVSPQEATFSLNIDSNKLNSSLEIKGIDDIYRALDTQFELLAGKDGVFRVFSNLDTLMPFDGDDKGLLFVGGGTGYLTKTIMAALAPDKDQLLKAVRNFLHKDRPVTFIHENDKLISPRTIRVSDNNGKDQLNGICRIEVV